MVSFLAGVALVGFFLPRLNPPAVRTVGALGAFILSYWWLLNAESQLTGVVAGGQMKGVG